MRRRVEDLAERAALAIVILLCLAACALVLVVPPDSLLTDLVYRAF